MANATRFTVYVKYNETDKAIRRFKKMTLENGIIKEYYNRKSYEKPSDKKRMENGSYLGEDYFERLLNSVVTRL